MIARVHESIHELNYSCCYYIAFSQSHITKLLNGYIVYIHNHIRSLVAFYRCTRIDETCCQFSKFIELSVFK